MKEIFFIRHAKSSWADQSLRDIERPLNNRGKRDGPIMAKKLAAIKAEVDLILCSPAKRAKKTASFFEKKILVRDKKILKEIYHAWPETLINLLAEIDDKYSSVLVFGHNPGFTSVFNHFSRDPLMNLPTCGIFGLKCSSSWSELDTTNTSVSHLMYPKMYKSSC